MTSASDDTRVVLTHWNCGTALGRPRPHYDGSHRSTPASAAILKSARKSNALLTVIGISQRGAIRTANAAQAAGNDPAGRPIRWPLAPVSGDRSPAEPALGRRRAASSA